MSRLADLPHLTVADLQLSVDVGFWEELRRLKLSEWKLAEPLAPLGGVVRMNVSDRVILTPPNLVHLSSASFAPARAEPAVVDGAAEVVDVRLPGTVKNYNFADGLGALDSRNALLSLVAAQLLRPALAPSPADESDGVSWAALPFQLLAMFTFVDAKAYRFYHREALPAIALESPVCASVVGAAGEIDACPLDAAAVQAAFEHGVSLLRQFPSRGCNPFLCVLTPGTAPAFVALSPRVLAGAAESGATAVLCFFDWCDNPNALSITARNIVTCLRLALPTLTSLPVLALRAGGPAKSVWAELSFAAVESDAAAALCRYLSDEPADALSRTNWKTQFPFLRVSGWRTKKVESLDLGSFINPVQRADSDSRFNLELMKWRVLPSLELHRLAECRALLLGTGTLGCNVARSLLMWGVRRLTLVDRGHVSFSNLARQSLFTFEDATTKRSKVDAAAAALRAILPTAEVRAVPLTIHMPGHRVDEGRRDEVLREVHQLEELIANCDVVFLLTDSREARWMPSIIAVECGTPVVNVALGFDTYVVMRHGIPSADRSHSNAVTPPAGAPGAPPPLGCYFCSDVVAPTDSLSFRALDEQCTVTRPAVSSIASAIAVDLLAEVYQHPAGFCCPAYRESSSGDAEAGKCRLGVIPQQIRGSVFSHSMHHLCGERNPFCTACSDKLLHAYREGGAEFLLQCVNAPLWIEEVCGVKALKEAWEADAKEICWSSDDEWADA